MAAIQPKQWHPTECRHGFLVGEPNDVYHASDSITSSKIKLFADRELKFRGQYITGEIESPTKSCFTFGSLVDCMITEPENFESLFVVKPESLRKPTEAQINAKKPSEASIEQIKEWNAFQDASRGKTIVSVGDIDRARVVADAIAEQVKAAQPSGNTIRVGQSTWRTKPMNGRKIMGVEIPEDGPEITFACKPDLFYWTKSGAPFAIDIKTVSSLEAFQRQFEEFGYYLQEAWYIFVINTVLRDLGFKGTFMSDYNFVFVAGETSQPYEACAFQGKTDCHEPHKTPFSIANKRLFGNAENPGYVPRMLKALITGVYMPYHSGVKQIDLSTWTYREEGISIL